MFPSYHRRAKTSSIKSLYLNWWQQSIMRSQTIINGYPDSPIHQFKSISHCKSMSAIHYIATIRKRTCQTNPVHWLFIFIYLFSRPKLVNRKNIERNACTLFCLFLFMPEEWSIRAFLPPQWGHWEPHVTSHIRPHVTPSDHIYPRSKHSSASIRWSDNSWR